MEEILKEIDEDLAFFEKYVTALRVERNHMLVMIENERRIRSAISGFGKRNPDGSSSIPFENENFYNKEKNE
jgi:hypothetical protein